LSSALHKAPQQLAAGTEDRRSITGNATSNQRYSRRTDAHALKAITFGLERGPKCLSAFPHHLSITHSSSGTGGKWVSQLTAIYTPSHASRHTFLIPPKLARQTTITTQQASKYFLTSVPRLID